MKGGNQTDTRQAHLLEFRTMHKTEIDKLKQSKERVINSLLSLNREEDVLSISSLTWDEILGE